MPWECTAPNSRKGTEQANTVNYGGHFICERGEVAVPTVVVHALNQK